MKKSVAPLILIVLTQLAFSSGCAQFMGGLRRDLNDEEETPYVPPPSVAGGRWTERGMMANDNMPEAGPYSNLNHGDRGPASGPIDSNGNVGSQSWVSPTQADTNRRDAYRNPASSADDGFQAPTAYSQTPSLPPPTKRQYKNGSRATADDFVDSSPSEGSLWASNGQTNYYFTKNKVRSIGDIITLALDDTMVRDIALETRRSLSPKERKYELSLLQNAIDAKYAGVIAANLQQTAAGSAPGSAPTTAVATPTTSDTVTTSAAAPSRSPASQSAQPTANASATSNQPVAITDEMRQQYTIPYANPNDIDVSKVLDIKSSDTMLGEIVERYPNGNYKIRTTKQVPYKNGSPRMVTVVGIVRSEDINEETDVVKSDKLYEYRINSVR